MMDLYTCYL